MENQNQQKFTPSTSAGQKFRVWWDEENNIGRARFLSEIDEQITKDASDQVDEILEKKGKSKWLVEPGEHKPSAAARKMIAERFFKNPQIIKHAVWSTSTMIRVTLKFLLGASGQDNAKTFSTEEEALKWLKSAD